jgi:hypothetical protein
MVSPSEGFPGTIFRYRAAFVNGKTAGCDTPKVGLAPKRGLLSIRGLIPFIRKMSPSISSMKSDAHPLGTCRDEYQIAVSNVSQSDRSPASKPFMNQACL